MKRLIVGVGMVCCLAAANPVIETYINEFSTDTAHQWVELNAQPCVQTLGSWVDGCRLTTSTSECTLDIPDRDTWYAVVDSASVANHLVGHGTFRLRSDTDFIRLVGGDIANTDSVGYPSEITGWKMAPAPPPGASSALWNYDYTGGQLINWYIDSIPTPGAPNDHYSSISGTISSDSGYVGNPLLTVSGTHGPAYYALSGYWTYFAGGLGAGKYQVVASGSSSESLIVIPWPESIDLGYRESLPNINFYFHRPDAVAESRAGPPASPRLSVRGPVLTISSSGPAEVDVWVHDESGRARSELFRGRLGAGRREFDLTGRLSPGVYFVRDKSPGANCTAKLVLTK